jgi:Domain of unknown function (DUF4159)
MSHRQWAWALGAIVALAAAVAWAQSAFREYPPLEGAESESALPPDYQKPAEFVFGRLMYPSNGTFGGGRGSNWKAGSSPWTIDYPLGDRNFARLMRRLTTINTRSVEQPVDLDDGDDVFNWPFLYMDTPGAASMTDAQIAKLREYLLRGGFLVCDSFFGSDEWSNFESSTLKRLFPDRPVVELPPDHSIFHAVYDLPTRVQVRNMRSLRSRGVGYRSDGIVPHWRAVLDDDGRAMIVILWNNDLGDAWQYADIPEYPQADTNFALRLGVNLAIYDLTH